MEKNKFTLRSFGGEAIFMGLICLFILFLLYLIVEDAIRRGLDVGYAAFSLLLLWSGIIFLRFIVRPKVELDDQKLSVAFFLSDRARRIWPRIDKASIDLKDVGSVTVARMCYFLDDADVSTDKTLQNAIHHYRHPARTRYYYQVATEAAFMHVPLIHVASKNPSRSGLTIPTKFFSKRGVRKLIQELKKRNIPVVTDPALKL
jgi:hypothetical protein